VFKALTFEKKKGIKTDLNEIKGEEIKLAVDFILPYLEKFIEDAGNDALDMLGLSKPLEITDRMKKIAKARAEFYAESTTDTTFDKLFKTLTEGFEGNETIQTLTERVQNVFKEFPEHRAEMIARTEATVSNNDGLLESYKQSGVVEGKEWIAVMDSKTRPEHQMLNGEVVELNKNFSNGLPYPSEPNCRCVIGPAIDE
jgi:SPP1 gp7 family putative phage head morphogenesis protein